MRSHVWYLKARGPLHDVSEFGSFFRGPVHSASLQHPPTHSERERERERKKERKKEREREREREKPQTLNPGSIAKIYTT
jgi:hypothetical protein